jgi:hypothetical protein
VLGDRYQVEPPILSGALIDKMKKKYKKPEVRVVELSFNLTQLAVCHTNSVTWPQNVPLSCAITGCHNPA